MDFSWMEWPFYIKSGKDMTLTYKLKTGEE
jgi:hypothetical protein